MGDDEPEFDNMREWSLLHVALGKSKTEVVEFLLKWRNLCILPRADLSDPELQPD